MTCRRTAGRRPWRPAPRAAQNTGDLPIASVARVLVAEDNVINQMLVRTLLELGNYEMLIVDNGRQAVAAAAWLRVRRMLLSSW